ncbi:MAG: purine-binding chemotaxis protein CheW [Planctomycetaceae bacterium]|jgi:purine-binding chemotaxis protein CheW
MADRESYCTFRIDDLYFGVEVRQVQEVIRHQHTTRVPLAPTVVHGLMNLRGQIVTALMLRHRLGLSASEDDSLPMNVVIRTADGPISLLVDEIGDVVQVDQDLFESPPETLQGEQRELIRGAFKLDDRLLLILDTEKVVDIAA